MSALVMWNRWSLEECAGHPLQNPRVTERLAIAKLGEAYELVPMPVAVKIQQRDVQCIIINDHSAEPEQDGDDLYADYNILDYLMW